VTPRSGLLLKEKPSEFEGRQPTEGMEEQMEAGSRCALSSSVGQASTTSNLCTPDPSYVYATILSRNSTHSMLRILRKYASKGPICPFFRQAKRIAFLFKMGPHQIPATFDHGLSMN